MKRRSFIRAAAAIPAATTAAISTIGTTDTEPLKIALRSGEQLYKSKTTESYGNWALRNGYNCRHTFVNLGREYGEGEFTKLYLLD